MAIRYKSGWTPKYTSQGTGTAQQPVSKAPTTTTPTKSSGGGGGGGYEVIREGQGYSTTTLQPGDIVTKKISPSISGGQQTQQIQQQRIVATTRTGGTGLYTPQQLAQQNKPQPQQFTGVVEKRDVSGGGVGRLEQRKFYEKGKEVLEEEEPTERKGKVTGFVVKKKGEEVVGVEETREGAGEMQPPIPPTREEILEESGGGIFVTKAEAKEFGVTTEIGEGEPSASQKTIVYSEYLLGGTEAVGKSGVTFIPATQLNIKTPSSEAMDFTFGESGKQFVGIGIPFTPAFVSFQDIKTWTNTNSLKISALMGGSPFFKPSETKVQGGAFGIRVGSELIPTTIGDVAITGATIGTYGFLPKVAKIGVGAGFTYLGGAGALNPKLTPEQRVASGLIGATAFTGTAFETIPYIKGIKAKLSSEYKPVVIAEEGFQQIKLGTKDIRVSPSEYANILVKENVIKFNPSANLPKGIGGITERINWKGDTRVSISKNIPSSMKEEIIAHELIHVNTPTPILTIGQILPYKLQPGEILAYKLQGKYAKIGFKIGTEDLRIGLIPEGYPSKTGVTINVQLPKTSPLVRGGFHVKESEKSLFLGKEQQLATSQRSLFKTGENIALEKEFFVTPQEPFLQIAETRISRLGLDEGFFKFNRQGEIGFGYPQQAQIGLMKGGVGRIETPTQFSIGTGTELEAIKTFGTIQNVKKIGVTSIRGQGVDIYSFDLGSGLKNVKTNIYTGTSLGKIRYSGEVVLSSLGIKTGKTTTKDIFTGTLPTTTTKFLTTNIPSYNIFTTRTTTGKTTKGTTRTGTPSIPTTIKTPFISPPTSTRITPPKSPSFYPKVSPPFTPKTPPNYPRYFPPKQPPTQKIFNWGGKQARGSGGFNVFIRRLGKFKPIGFNLPKEKAFALGKSATQFGLAQSFKISGKGMKGVGVPKGWYPKYEKKEGLIFIEQPRTKINTGMEKSLLRLARGKKLKGGKRRR